MTQPNSVNMTFDTSLVDLNPNVSFSTTESDTSDFGTVNPSNKTPIIQQSSLFEEQSQETPKNSQMAKSAPKTSTPVQHVPTQEAYDQWASVYDSDGNMLQSIDNDELSTLLPQFIEQAQDGTTTSTLNFIDLGCGTGRNTFKLLDLTSPQTRNTTITGLDFSRGMLDIATEKLNSGQTTSTTANAIRFMQCDCFPTVHNPSTSPLPAIENLQPANGVISTLVLEHIPLKDYFATLSSLLAPGGYALVTNMHADMGAKSQAGFVNEQGVKVRGSSYVYTVEETVDAAKGAGLEVVSVRERGVAREDVDKGVVGERGWKWVGVNVWFGVVLRRGL